MKLKVERIRIKVIIKHQRDREESFKRQEDGERVRGGGGSGKECKLECSLESIFSPKQGYSKNKFLVF